MARKNMSVIWPHVDNSMSTINSQYTVTYFSTMQQFREKISLLPIVVNALLITEESLPFNAEGVRALNSLLEHAYIIDLETVIYLISDETSKDSVELAFKANAKVVAIYQGELDNAFVRKIIEGERRDANETENFDLQFRVRIDAFESAKATLQSYHGIDAEYHDEIDDLAEAVEELNFPETMADILHSGTSCSVLNVVGIPSMLRSYYVFYMANVLATKGRTVIIEKDTEYNTLTDIVLKNMDEDSVLFIDYADVVEDITGVFQSIKDSKQNLVLIGRRNTRTTINYSLLTGLVIANLDIPYFVFEYDPDEAVPGTTINVVAGNTVRDVLNTTSALPLSISPKDICMTYIDTADYGNVSMSAKDCDKVVSMVLNTEDFKTNGSTVCRFSTMTG